MAILNSADQIAFQFQASYAQVQHSSTALQLCLTRDNLRPIIRVLLPLYPSYFYRSWSFWGWGVLLFISPSPSSLPIHRFLRLRYLEAFLPDVLEILDPKPASQMAERRNHRPFLGVLRLQAFQLAFFTPYKPNPLKNTGCKWQEFSLTHEAYFSCRATAIDA